jgi:nucleoside 2-deoxyribosyltransferase
MSFSPDQEKTRIVIKEAIVECGYIPVLIDEVTYSSDVTINDAMVTFIKKSKFIVGDFSEHKHGVYFEVGYALGSKKPAIFLCNESQFDKSHFDTNHYPHIIYKTHDELKSKLINKIKAWID